MANTYLPLFLLASIAVAPPSHAAKRPLLLWEVEKEGAVSHLLGTCHLPIPLEHALPAPHDGALTGARLLFVEVEVGTMDPASALRLGFTDVPLSSLLTPDQWQALAFSARDKLPAPMLVRMRPWVAWAALTVAPATGGQPLLDKATVDLAAGHSVPVRPLETVDDQVAVLGKLDPFFLDGLRFDSPTAQAAEGQFDALRDACGGGDLDGLEATTADPTHAEAWATLLDARHDAWMPQLEPELAQGGVFVAVGAAHMVGPQGLLARLESRGYAVTRIVWKGPKSPIDVPVEAFTVRPPAPYDEAVLAAYEASAPTVAETVCAEGGFAAVCLEPDPVACRARFGADLAGCYRQWADRLPPLGTAPDDALAESLFGCGISGLVGEAMVREARSADPMCAPMWDAMKPAP